MLEPSPNVTKLIQEIDQVGFRSWLIKELTFSFQDARKNKINTFNEHRFEINWPENIIKLTDAILSHAYHPSPSISFIVYEPMIREIFAAPFIDRVVHHFLYRMQSDWWDRRFIYDSYSCRNGKGTLFGIKRIQQMMRKSTENFTKDAYIIKLDIKGYFMSLPRQKLYERVRWGLEQQFQPHFYHSATRRLFSLCDYLWHTILLDDPANKSRRRGLLSNWDNLPPEKSLYTRDPGYGIVIGNLTSQLASNIYLDQLDRFIKMNLKIKYYGRYVDDFVSIVSASDYRRALKNIPIIEDFLHNTTLLTLHPNKRYIQPVDKGVNFLGARIYPHCIYPSNRLQGKFEHIIADIVQGKHHNYESFIAYLGLLRHLDADKFVRKIFDKYNLDFNLYLESKAEDRRSFMDIIDDLFGDWQSP